MLGEQGMLIIGGNSPTVGRSVQARKSDGRAGWRGIKLSRIALASLPEYGRPVGPHRFRFTKQTKTNSSDEGPVRGPTSKKVAETNSVEITSSTKDRIGGTRLRFQHDDHPLCKSQAHEPQAISSAAKGEAGGFWRASLLCLVDLAG